ncbi:MAG TPA: ArsR family transcriptional regulator [Candidatus Thermoplasmatota archaeon]|jgi:predicted DNA-binding ArsR family transcriptional regulator|nr:ArsR family transcriptional regulator [Candidatus Thermoplasmatota archaeon]
MRRIKVISEPTDLVPLLRALDTDTKREVFKDIASQWCPTSYIQRKYGDEGEEALRLFEKTKLVETRFENVGGTPEKVFHSYYSSFNINCSTAVVDVGEILAVASMPEPEFRVLEGVILDMVGGEGASARAVTEKLNIPLIRLRSLLKRSTRLDLRGHVVVRTDEPTSRAATAAAPR